MFTVNATHYSIIIGHFNMSELYDFVKFGKPPSSQLSVKQKGQERKPLPLIAMYRMPYFFQFFWKYS